MSKLSDHKKIDTGEKVKRNVGVEKTREKEFCV